MSKEATARSAMKLALEALEKLVRFESDSWELGSCRIAGQATRALREALASEAKKPDFWEGYVPEPVKPRGEATLAQQEPVACECHRCIDEKGLNVNGLPLSMTKMILCPECGNKRCPKASDHRLACTNSNEPGQPGSIYTSPPAQRTWVNATTWRGLTDEEIEKLTVELRDIPVTLAFAIEAKLKEKNT